MSNASDTATQEVKPKAAMKIAIVGGGICGLTCAIGLKKAGLDVHIYEAAAKFGEIGAAVGFGPNAIVALRQLGVLDEVVSRSDEKAPAVRPFLMMSGSGENEVIYDYPVQETDVGLGMLRSAFLDSLLHLVDPEKCHFNKRCTKVSPSLDGRRTKLSFSDGTEAEADVVIGADGIKSVVRTHVVDGAEEACWQGTCNIAFTNTHAYRGLIPKVKLEEVGMSLIGTLAKRPLSFIGPDKHIIAFPVRGGQVINVVAFTCDRSSGSWSPPITDSPWVNPRTTADLLAEYKGWSADAQHLLGCMESPSVWSIHGVDPLLESYCKGRVVLIGDAAHGMLPHLGAGAGQGMEDVLLITGLLVHPQTTLENIEVVFKAYDIIRRPRANMVHRGSTQAGDIYETYGPSGGSFEGIRSDLTGMWDPVWRYDVRGELGRAEEYLRAQGRV